MIQGFRTAETEQFFQAGKCPRQWRPFERVAARKLDYLDQAGAVSDLKAPPGNRLEKLKGDRKGQWSIRINDQWRICFRWDDGDQGPSSVEIVDYH
ncbi:MAG: type II toxin-antitoxin system RelE/ParE family toxin [Beijerinckiaceae bacterium]